MRDREDVAVQARRPGGAEIGEAEHVFEQRHEPVFDADSPGVEVAPLAPFAVEGETVARDLPIARELVFEAERAGEAVVRVLLVLFRAGRDAREEVGRQDAAFDAQAGEAGARASAGHRRAPRP